MSNRDIDPTGDFLAATRESQGQPVDAEARKVDFGPDTDWDAAAHVRFLRRQGGASSGYTADLIQNLHCQLTAARAECEGLRAALEPFAEAWDVAVHREDIVRHLSMGQLGELAAHEVSGVHFRNARAALAASHMPVGDGWRSMDGAPKDRTRIILAWTKPESLSPHIELGYWSEGKSSWVNTYGHSFSGNPDLWFLPPDPRAASTGEAGR